MSLHRLLLVGMTTFGLMALPAVTASAAADESAVPVAGLSAASAAKSPPYLTRIGFFPFDRTRVYGTETVVAGQILLTEADGGGSLRGEVTLQRRWQGNSNWVTIGEVATTRNETKPRFTFSLRTVANANYRVRYAGDEDLQIEPSFEDTKVSAFRKITTKVKSRQLLVYGKVAPTYTGKRMAVQRKTCATCAFKTVRTIKVRAGSKYQATLTAPANGRWWWRLTTKKDRKFIASATATVVTRRVVL